MNEAETVRMLVLDDDPARVKLLRRTFPRASITWVETVSECIGMLEREWDEIRLDHDLGGEIFVDSDRDDCGMEVARDMAANVRAHLADTAIIVHTRNEFAGPPMVAILRRAGYNARYTKFRF